jgi:N-acetylmuramoyl-L-alanine amidase
LIEVCNLNNPDDRKLLRTRAYREKVASAIADALVAFYGGSSTPAPRAGAVTGTR